MLWFTQHDVSVSSQLFSNCSTKTQRSFQQSDTQTQHMPALMFRSFSWMWWWHLDRPDKAGVLRGRTHCCYPRRGLQRQHSSSTGSAGTRWQVGPTRGFLVGKKTLHHCIPSIALQAWKRVPSKNAGSQVNIVSINAASFTFFQVLACKETS